MPITLDPPQSGLELPDQASSARAGVDTPASGLVDLHATLDALLDADLVALSAAHVREPGRGPAGFHMLLAEADRAIRRLERFKLRVVAASEVADVAKDAGMIDTGAWVAAHTNTGGADASKLVKLARALETLSATGQALGEGAVRSEHATVIAHTMQQLPESLDAGQRGEVERKLVGWAKEVNPGLLRRKARSALLGITSREAAQRHHANVLVSEEQQALAKTKLTLHDNADGTISGHFTVPIFAGSVLKKIVQQMCSPRRQTGGKSTGGADLSAGQTPHAMGLAFIELLEHLPTDRLHSKVAATVIVTLQHQQLVDDLAGAGLDTGDEISPSEARRLACNSGILPAVLNGKSLPLDLGRMARFFNEPQRVALTTEHSGCAVEGCDRPYAWCELHHLIAWARGGHTDLKDAVPLCGPHHRLIHDPGHTFTRTPSGRLRITRRC